MKKPKLPNTDSIQELAKFWDAHDLTEFEDELDEVGEPVFVRDAPVQVPLAASEAEAARRIARAKGVSVEELLHRWVVQRLTRAGK